MESGDGDKRALHSTIPPSLARPVPIMSTAELDFRPIGYVYHCTLGESTYPVYKVANEDGGVFALKWIKLEKGELTPNVIRELSIMFDIQHANILRLYKVFIHEGAVHLIMELMKTDMHEHMQDNNISLDKVKVWLKQILSAVAYLHDRGIIHRDLKPENLLLTSDENVKLADFGLARGFFKNDQLTPGIVTMWYRAPELLLGSCNYSTPVDVWSVGCIFAGMVNGRILFSDDSSESADSGTSVDSEIKGLFRIFRIMGTPTEDTWPGVTSLPEFDSSFQEWAAQDLSAIVPNLDPTGIDLLNKMLCMDPSKRITAREALEHEYFKDIGSVP